MYSVHLEELEMHGKTKQWGETEIRLKEPYHRTAILHSTDSTSLCQMRIDFEERTWDLHMASPILDLVDIWLQNWTIRQSMRVNENQQKTENVKEVVW